jgi:TatD DNase family protein
VLETDSPDIPPWWLYRTAAQRDQGQPQGRNEPMELPRIAAELAKLRGLSLDALAAQLADIAVFAFPKLAALLAPVADSGCALRLRP